MTLTLTAEVHAFEQDLRDVRALQLLDPEWLDRTWGPTDNLHDRQRNSWASHRR
jgi:hypothetical protein